MKNFFKTAVYQNIVSFLPFDLTYIEQICMDMKKIVSAFLLTAALASTTALFAQDEDKSKRPSPPDSITITNNGLNMTINYSKPAVKGRTIGKEIAPYGEVWRTGANEATTFDVNRDVKVEGQALKAGKYALFTIPGTTEWTLIFNKQAAQWGAFKYDEKQDALRVKVKPTKAPSFTERMTFADKKGKVALMWGNTEVDFAVK